MATSKPAQLANLTPGKLVDTVRNFCATINWVISCLSEMKTEDDEDIPGLTDGRPKIPSTMKLKSGEDSNIKVSKEKDKDGYYTIDIYYK